MGDHDEVGVTLHAVYGLRDHAASILQVCDTVVHTTPRVVVLHTVLHEVRMARAALDQLNALAVRVRGAPRFATASARPADGRS
jgi:hypothetical protein